MERYHIGGKIKEIEIGTRVYLKHVPKKGESKKLQPLFDGPFRVIDKVSDVVINVRHIKTLKEVKVHTDRVRVTPEDQITIKDSKNVRRAYADELKLNDEEYYVLGELPTNKGKENIEIKESSTMDPAERDEVRESTHLNTNESDTDRERRSTRYNFRSTTQIKRWS